MQTRLTDTFGISLPLVCPGMSYIAVPELVAATSNAGGLGILATGPLSAEQTRAAIRR
ncbi:MAG: nitronate monooxygenase, partial [Vogesella sp.]|uniref:nitronate monooxygenase n=1 Tax=Vogesella sp. TaxID=1904252 RepID=UPI003F2D4C6B